MKKIKYPAGTWHNLFLIVMKKILYYKYCCCIPPLIAPRGNLIIARTARATMLPGCTSSNPRDESIALTTCLLNNSLRFSVLAPLLPITGGRSALLALATVLLLVGRSADRFMPQRRTPPYTVLIDVFLFLDNNFFSRSKPTEWHSPVILTVLLGRSLLWTWWV